MNATQLKEFAQLAQAAYAYFDGTDFRFRGGRPEDLLANLRSDDRGSFTAAGAITFSDRYAVLHQYTDNPSSIGFSATLFQDRSTGRLVFSIRGTEFQGDLVRDLLVTDLRIGVDGYASPQVIPLYRYFKQLTAGAGQNVTYSAAEIANLEAVYFDMFEDSAARRAQWGALRSDLLADVGVDAGQGSGVALIGAGQNVDVAGHSLGGHLALLMDRLFPDRVDQIVTLNAPGFLPQSTSVLKRFSPDWNSASILRIEASGDLVSEIGTTYPGTRVLVAQENEAATSIGTNHSSVNAVDGLVLTELVGRLDPRILSDPRLLKPAIDGSAVTPIASYEALLDGLRILLIGPGQAETSVNTDLRPAGREGFYNNMTSLAASPAFETLRGLVAVGTASGSAIDVAARTDFAAFLTLHTLSPVALRANSGNEAAVAAVLAGAWTSVHQAWSADRALTPAQREQGLETYSDAYLADRAAMLDGLVTRNRLNSDTVSARPGVQGMHFKDVASGIEFDLGLSNSVIVKRQTLFGHGGDDTLNGLSLADHLYGGSGNDTLSGQGGADRLEGQAGADHLNGGTGADTLLGGAGADTLDGGSDNDRLLGGAGLDSYSFSGAFGIDSVEDAGGQGGIEVTGLGTLSGAGADQISPTDWQTADRTVTYSLVALDTAHQNLVITVAAGANQGAVVIKNWSDGQLGITLGTTPRPSVATNTFAGDFIKAADGSQYLTTPTGYQSAGVQAGAADVLGGTSGADSLLGLGGNDGLDGSSGDDVLDGGEGSDLLLGGFGADTILGGLGNDFIFGSASEINLPRAVSFAPPAASGVELARGFSWVAYDPSGVDAQGNNVVHLAGANISPIADDEGNFIDGGAGDDRIDAGTGADVVHGGGDNDLIAGMDLADVLLGDAGNDSIMGDGVQSLSSGTYTALARHGNDILAGGLGDDVLWGQGGSDELYGGDDADSLFGDDTSLVDTPLPSHGDDYLDGGAGDDQLTGGGRDDILLGGSGDDALWGDGGAVETSNARFVEVAFQGNDRLDGGEGNDYLQGEGWDDTLMGGSGADTLIGDDAESHLAGTAHGRDYLDGGEGDDALAGGGGTDTLIGGAGNDQLEGDADLADVSAPFHGDDALEGGDGSDTLLGGGGNDHLDGGSQSDGLHGGSGNDSLYGGSGNDLLYGDDGTDLLDGGAGADDLRGGAGDDVYRIDSSQLTDGTSLDTITDDEGNDKVFLDGVGLASIHVTQAPDGFLELAWGEDQGIYVVDGLKSSIETIEASGEQMSYQQLIGQRLTTAVTATSWRVGGRLLGGAANDFLTVTQSENRIAGGRGDDIINLSTTLGSTVAMSLGDGMDRVVAARRSQPSVPGESAPKNVLQLGAGFDSGQLQIYRIGQRSFVLSLNDQGDGVLFDATPGPSGTIAPGDEPFDTVQLSDGSTIDWQQIPNRGFVVLPMPTQGNDNLVLSPLADTIDGLGGDDRIDGLSGNDLLIGGNGNDTLIGGLGNDHLYAGSGTDSLIGGAGNDHLFGGVSASQAVLEGGDGDDQYFFRFGFLTAVEGQASDASTTSGDVYSFADTGTAGGVFYETFSIADRGGIDRIRLDSSFITPTNTVVRHTGTGLSITSLPLNIHIEGAVNANGTSNAENSVESVVFRDGTIWTADQLRVLSIQSTPGNDAILGYDIGETIDGGSGADTLDGAGGNDTLDAGVNGSPAGGGVLVGTTFIGDGIGSLIGGTGDDVYIVRSGAGHVVVGSAERNSSDDDGFDVLRVMAGRADVTISIADRPFGGIDYLTVQWNDGSASAQIGLYGTTASAFRTVEQIDFLDGTSMDVAQYLSSTAIPSSAGNDSISLSSLDNLVSAGEGNDTIRGGRGDDTLYGEGGDDRLESGGGNNHLHGGTGNDTLIKGYNGFNGATYFDGGAGNDFIAPSFADTVMFGFGAGNDTIDGSGGATLSLDGSVAPGDVHVKWSPRSFYSGGTSPSWTSSLQLTFGQGLDSIDAAARMATGNHDPNRPTQVGIGMVRFQEGTTWSLETLVAMANAGTTGDDVLFDALDQGVLDGGNGNDALFGLSGNNLLSGGAGNDELMGGVDNDILIGGAGDDILYGWGGIDTVGYARGDGDDRVYGGFASQTAIAFSAGISVGDITLTRPASALVATVAGGGSITVTNVDGVSNLPAEIRFADGTVWDQAQVIERALSGGVADDQIFGFEQRGDSIVGGAGNDVLEGRTGSDTLAGGAGNDTLRANGHYVGGELDEDVLIGGTGDDVLHGGAGYVTYRFDAGFGHDTIDYSGGSRDPSRPATAAFGAAILPADVVCSRGPWTGLTLWVSSTGDTVHVNGFFAAPGSDELSLSRSLDQVTFSDGTVWSASDIVSRLVNVVTPAADMFYGTTGPDIIDALGGDDWVDAGSGNDIVLGGAGNDQLSGGMGDDTLSGGPGSDGMQDSDGNDRYEYSLGDGQDTIEDLSGTADLLVFGSGIAPSDVRVVSNSDGAAAGWYELLFTNSSGGVTAYGVDAVTFHDGTVWTASYIDQEARSIYGTGGSDTLNGTAQSDRLLGLAGDDRLNGAENNDWLDGGSGADTLRGGTGNDTYVVDSVADSVVENSGQGADRVLSSITYTLTSNVESLELTGASAINGTGNTLNNAIVGNAAANTLSGAAGSDTMSGGAGNDLYVVDAAGDVVVENVAEGSDTVQASVSYTLSANVENLNLSGSSAINGTGNALNNVLAGNSGANTLSGGAGNDTYVVGTGDIVAENANEGIDTVQSSIAWTLGSNLENLTLTGGNAVNGTGNGLDNLLTGNSAANTLMGAAGNDIYLGGLGNDMLTDSSTTSSDIYRWGIGQGNDSISDAGGSDRIEILPGVTSSQITLTRGGNHLQVGIAGASDVLTVLNWYTNSVNRIEEIRLSDGTVIGAGAAPQSVVAGEQASTLSARAGTVQGDAVQAGMSFSPALWLLAAKNNLLLDAMAQFDPPAGAWLIGDADRLVNTMPVLAVNAV